MSEKKSKADKHEKVVEHASASQMAARQEKRRRLAKIAITALAILAMGGLLFYIFAPDEVEDTEEVVTSNELTVEDTFTEVEVEMVPELYVEERGGQAEIEITDDGFSAFHIFIMDTATLTWRNASNASCELEVSRQGNNALFTETIQPREEFTQEVAVADGELLFECTNDDRAGGYIGVFGS